MPLTIYTFINMKINAIDKIFSLNQMFFRTALICDNYW